MTTERIHAMPRRRIGYYWVTLKDAVDPEIQFWTGVEWLGYGNFYPTPDGFVKRVLSYIKPPEV